MSSTKIIFLLESVSQPRCIRRINSFINSGYDVEIFGVQRNKYSQNAIIKNHNIQILSTQKDGSGYFKKMLRNYYEIKKIIKKFENQKVIYYCFGMSLMITFKIISRRKYIYEIADILYGYKKFNGFRWLFKLIDTILIKKSVLTVLTSQGFAHFFNLNDNTNIIIQPNKVSSYFKKIDKPKIKIIKSNSLVFSYVGAFRYPNTIFRFARIIGEKYPQHFFYFYGDSVLTSLVNKYANRYENIKYFGSFKSPDDLKSIYEKIDIIVACYDSTNLNERIAEPNKFYESLYFKKPIIVSKNTFLSKKVEKSNSGFVINAFDDKSIINFIDNLKYNKIENILSHIDKIDNDDLIDDDSSNIIALLKKYDS
jgi:succinoglycan biosynthesis protein ExoL